MGQCYSVYLKAKFKDADAFVRLTREFADKDQWSQEDKDNLKGIDSIINFFISGSPHGVEVRYEDGWPVFRGDFDASYLWGSVMEDWFRAVAPSLEVGSEIEVWPDSGSWKCTVLKEDGTCDIDYSDDDEEVDEEDEES